MGKINLSFNNAKYSLDESSLSAATAALRTHLSTTMSGTGATINLGGTAYNIDSVKLSAATSDFISHLLQIAGNGSKVVVSGIEYHFDTTKVRNAVSELETVLGNLNNPDVVDIVIVLDEAILDYSVLG